VAAARKVCLPARASSSRKLRRPFGKVASRREEALAAFRFGRNLSLVTSAASLPSCKFTDVTCRPCPGGTIENSPAFQGWVKTQYGIESQGTAEIRHSGCINNTSPLTGSS